MTLYFATSNRGKLREAKAKLAPVQVERLVLPYPEIQAFTLEEVVAFGLDWIRERSDRDVMIEDSGLFIEGLKGLPGVYSAYVYKWVGCAGILKLMDGVENRAAEFRSCIGLLLDGESRILTGSCAGAISEEARGAGGFGFDPIFIPRGSKRTFAEMSLEEKNALSHRGDALDQVARLLAGRKGA